MLLTSAGIGLFFSGVVFPPSKPFQASQGEEILITSNTNPDKEAGVKAFAAGNFATAIDKLRSSLQVKPNDPEALIYLNNATAASNGHTLKIAVVGPIGSNLNIAQEILRGVAQAQNETNRSGGINGALLQVEIANDNNNPEIAKHLATEFVRDTSLLAVVGHNASEASIAAAPVYQQAGLVMISPTSAAKELSGIGKYVFRTVSIYRNDAIKLSRYAIKIAAKNKFAICTDSASPYSQSIKEEFTSAVFANGSDISSIDCDFSDPNFNPGSVILQALSDGADSLVLLPSVDRLYQAIDVAKINKGRLALFSGSTMCTWETLRQGQVDVNGMVLSVFWHPAQFPANPFPANATKLWGGVVNWRTAAAYDATQVIITALKQNNTRSGVQKVMSSPGFSVDGATGKVRFLPSGDRDGEGILVKIQPGSQSGTGYDFVPLGR